MVALKFASSHNMVAFLDRPTKSDGFEKIVDFLNAHPIKYTLTVNPIIYTSCIEQFWATAKVKTVNGEVQIQALVDKKKVIVTEAFVRRDLQLFDENGTECLPNATIFAELERMGYENLTQKLAFYKAFFSPQWKFLIHTILQCLSAKTTPWNEFSSTMASAVICLATNQKFNFSKYIFDNMVKNLEGGVKFLMYPRQGKDFSGRDTPLFPTMIVQVQEQVGEEPVTDDTENVASVPTHSNDPLLSGEDRFKLNELMELCTSLSQRVLDLENKKTSQATEIPELKKRVKKLEGKRKSKPPGMKRLLNISRSTQVVSSEDEEVTLVDKTQGRNDEEMFDTGILDGKEVFVEQDVVEKKVSTAKVATTTTVDELTLAQTLIEIKAAKPKAVTTTATTTTTVVTRPKARGVVVQEPNAELEEEEKLARQKEEDAKIAEWDNVQAMMDADYELAARLQAEEQGELTIEEKSRLFVELMNKRKKHFARLRAEEQRIKPPTKAQKRNTMSTYLKNMAGYKHNQLKTKSFEDIQMLFDKEMKRVNIFVDMDTELVKDCETRTEGSSKRTREELESENLKKHKLDENVEAEVDDEAEIKKHMEIVPDDEVAIDAIPLATKPPIIFDKELLQQNIKLQLDAELEEEEKLARQREEDANIVEWDNVQAMMDADYELAARLQAEEQGELTIEEKSRLFVELMNKRKKHFTRLRAEKKTTN
ncbi:hypothetical protein Tco_0103416 [Tanacetum coccineum]